MTIWSVETVAYDGELAQQLIEQLQEEYVVRYGSRDRSVVLPEEFAPPLGLLLIATVDGEPVAMGGFRDLGEGIAEIKRMYVPERHRRRGYSRRMLLAIEDAARDAGFQTVWLSTGIEQPEAMALYETCGYSTIPGFGHYKDYDDSLFYGKKL